MIYIKGYTDPLAQILVVVLDENGPSPEARIRNHGSSQSGFADKFSHGHQGIAPATRTLRQLERQALNSISIGN